MLDFATVIELMKQYGYSSTSIHPYIYQKDDTLGICYTYIDEEYGLLERIKTFDNLEEFENFLKEQSWLKSNAKNYNVRMILDNYEASMPKVLYLRNEKIMMEGEMFDIDNFDLRESQRRQMDEVSQILYEAGDLLLVYDEIKARQLQYLQNLIVLKNELRGKYFDLQKEVDKYNKYKVERELHLLPDVLDKGSIDEDLEIAIKNQYNMYIAERPSLDEIKDFIRQVWELNMKLELNTKYYEAQKEENDTRNELKVVNQKLELMLELNEELRPIFGIDLVSRFKKINDKCRRESKYMSKNYVEEKLALVEKKYAVFDKLNPYYMSDYLREAIQNTNYDDLALKYSVAIQEGEINKTKLPLNEVAADLAIQYKEKLSSEEQSILILYNNSKYAKIFNAILEIDKYEEKPIKDILKALNSVKGISKLKSECYESVKKRINDPVNENVKNSLFANIDFTTFDTFIMGMIKKLVTLKNINNKMTIKSDFNMYSLVQKVDAFAKKKYISLTHDLNTLLNDAKDLNWMIGTCLLKENLPVLYAPYYFDLGDMYSKGASPLMEIKDMTTFELLIETADVSIYTDENKVEVARYYTEPKLMENISYVDDIKLKYSTTFNKFSLVSNLPAVEEVPAVSDNTVLNNNVPVEGNTMTAVSNGVLENVSNVTAPTEEQNTVSLEPVAEVVPPVASETPVVEVVNTTDSANVEQPEEAPKAEVAQEEVAVETKEEASEPVVEQVEPTTETPTDEQKVNEPDDKDQEPKVEVTTEVPSEEPVIPVVEENKEEVTTEEQAVVENNEDVSEPVAEKVEEKETESDSTGNESSMVSMVDIKNNEESAPVVEPVIPIVEEPKGEEVTTEEVVENKEETKEPVKETMEDKVVESEPVQNESSMVSATEIKSEKEEKVPSEEPAIPVIEENKSEEVKTETPVEEVKEPVIEETKEEEVVADTTKTDNTMVSATDTKNEKVPSEESVIPIIEENKDEEVKTETPVKEEVKEPEETAAKEKKALAGTSKEDTSMVSATEIKTEKKESPSTKEPMLEKKSEEATKDKEVKAPEAVIPVIEPEKVEETKPVVENNEKKDETVTKKVEETKKETQVVVKEEKPKEEKKDNGFVTFTNQSSTTDSAGSETQEISLADFKPVVNSNEGNNQPVATPTQKNIKVVKKVSSIGTASKPKAVVTNSNVNNSNVTNSNVTPSQSSTPVKKNIVVKSVGSIGKPLNRNNN